MPYCFDLTAPKASASLPSLAWDSHNIWNYGFLCGAWIKTNSTAKQDILHFYSTAKFYRYFTIENNQLSLECNTGTGEQVFQSADGSNVCDGEWHHVAVAVCQSVAAFYKDGVLLGTTSLEHKGDGSTSHQTAPADGNFATVTVGTSSAAGTRFTGYLALPWCEAILAKLDAASLAAEATPLVSATYRSILQQQDMASRSLLLYSPMLGCNTISVRQSNLVNQQPITLNGAAIIYDYDTFLDGYQEIWLNAPSAPFVAFSGGSLTAFNYIMSRINCGGVTPAKFRSYYTNEVQQPQLSTWSAEIFSLQWNATIGTDEATFGQVQTQLCNELDAAGAILTYKQDVSDFFSLVHADNVNQLQAVSTALSGMVSTQSVSGDLFNALDLVTEALSKIDGMDTVISIVKNVWTVMNAGNSISTQLPANTYGPFTAQYVDLQTQVDNNWATAIAQIATQVNAILTDGGKLQSTLVVLRANQLDWEVSYNGNLPAIVQAHRFYYCQLLMLTMYSMYTFQPQDNDGSHVNPCIPYPQPVPANFFRWATQSANGALIGRGTQNAVSTIPDQASSDYLFGTVGIALNDFWNWEWNTIGNTCR